MNMDMIQYFSSDFLMSLYVGKFPVAIFYKFKSRFFINLKVFEENQLVGHVSPSHFHRQIALWLKAIKSIYKIDAFFISNAFFSAQSQLFAYLFLESSFKCCLGVAWYVKCQCYPHIEISQLRATLVLNGLIYISIIIMRYVLFFYIWVHVWV